MENENKVCLEIDKKEIAEKVANVIINELEENVRNSVENKFERFNIISLGKIKMGRIFRNGKVDNYEYIYSFIGENDTIQRIEILVFNGSAQIKFNTNYLISNNILSDLLKISKEIEKEVNKYEINNNNADKDNQQ